MKKTLSLDEMIEYTTINKRIFHSDINESKNFLLLNNYQNVISPHKHNFHSGKNDEMKHIYTEDIDFSNYIEMFDNERKDYKKIREKACMFEFYFKNLVQYYFFLEYRNFCRGNKIKYNEEGIVTFLEHRSNTFSIKILKKQCTKVIHSIIEKYRFNVKKDMSPFVFFTKLHFQK